FQQFVDVFLFPQLGVDALEHLLGPGHGLVVPGGHHDVQVHGPRPVRITIEVSVLVAHLERNRGLDARKHLDRPADGEIPDGDHNEPDDDGHRNLNAASHPMSPLSYTAAGLSVSAACCRKSFREYCVEVAEPAPPWS